VLGVALAAGSRTAGIPEPELVTVLLPEWSTFDHTAKKWVFTALPLQVARGNRQVRLKDAAIRETGMKIEHGEQEWQDALVYGDSVREASELEDMLVLRYRNLRTQWTAAEQSRIEKSTRGVHARIRERDPEGSNVFVIRLPAQPVAAGEPYLLDLTFETREKANPVNARAFTVTKQVWPVVLPSSISDNSIWLRADLHLHSRYSDGGASRHLYAIRDEFLLNRGYRIAYMTDHVGQNTSPPQFLNRLQCLCPPHGWCVHHPSVFVPNHPCATANTWSCYVTNTQRVSVPTGISFFPGMELSAAAVRPPDGVRAADGEGHALGYGITSFPMRRWCPQQLSELQVFDLTHGPQAVIDELNENTNTAQPVHRSLASIAHPASNWTWPLDRFRYDWPWLGHLNPNDLTRVTTHFRGMELMSGAQTNFSLTSYYTHILLHVTDAWWNSNATPWHERRRVVDNALRAGRTIASLCGSFGFVAINGVRPGAIRTGQAVNSVLNMELHLTPSVNGTAQVRLFQGDRADGNMSLAPTPIFSENIPVTAGTMVTRTFTRTFPGGDQYYWLFVDIAGTGTNDVIYTTPIFISSTP
jgi:hypothetical protein